MFTGIVTAIGRVRAIGKSPAGLALDIGGSYRGLALGESVAVAGACLTVERKGRGWFGVTVVRTSLGRTRFGSLQAGDQVNLERALTLRDHWGGHLVYGHVDGLGTVVGVQQRRTARLLDIRVPREVAKYSVPLGSITVDGVSLTVNAIPRPGIIQVSLIPHTRSQTTLGGTRKGDRVHLEADSMGKYVWHLMRGHRR